VTEFEFMIDVPASGDWKNVTLLRDSVQGCTSAVLSNVACGQALSIVAGELLENAVKYGDWSRPTRKLRLRVWGHAGRAFVQVENPVVRDGEGLGELTRMLEWIRSFPSPRDAYRARLREVAAVRDGTRSGLGVVRIACEARCEVSVEIRGDILRVTAARELPQESAQP
jgi:hypothetical protein